MAASSISSARMDTPSELSFNVLSSTQVHATITYPNWNHVRRLHINPQVSVFRSVNSAEVGALFLIMRFRATNNRSRPSPSDEWCTPCSPNSITGVEEPFASFLNLYFPAFSDMILPSLVRFDTRLESCRCLNDKWQSRHTIYLHKSDKRVRLVNYAFKTTGRSFW